MGYDFDEEKNEDMIKHDKDFQESGAINEYYFMGRVYRSYTYEADEILDFLTVFTFEDERNFINFKKNHMFVDLERISTRDLKGEYKYHFLNYLLEISKIDEIEKKVNVFNSKLSLNHDDIRVKILNVFDRKRHSEKFLASIKSWAVVLDKQSYRFFDVVVYKKKEESLNVKLKDIMKESVKEYSKYNINYKFKINGDNREDDYSFTGKNVFKVLDRLRVIMESYLFIDEISVFLEHHRGFSYHTFDKENLGYNFMKLKLQSMRDRAIELIDSFDK